MRLLRGAILAAIAGFVIVTCAKALRAPFVTGDFPESLAVKVELLPLVFPLHMVTGGLALVLVPFALLMRRWPRWHKLAGRIAAADVAVAGVTALPVALVAPVTPWSAAGFAAQGCVWLALLGAGIGFIRAGRIAAHRACMLMMLATTSGAVFFRIWLALWAIHGTPRHFETFYAFDAWFAWALPLGIVAMLLQRTGSRASNL
jgi:uncharacterized membrane protein